MYGCTFNGTINWLDYALPNYLLLPIHNQVIDTIEIDGRKGRITVLIRYSETLFKKNTKGHLRIKRKRFKE